MAEIGWTREAERWLRDIFDYIALDNPQAGAQVVAGIYSSAQRLSVFPELGYKYPGSGDQVRIFLYGHYRIAYLIKRTETSISWASSTALSTLINTSCEPSPEEMGSLSASSVWRSCGRLRGKSDAVVKIPRASHGMAKRHPKW